ncbi:YbaB/EbfC family nucleoid-associated protein [Paractinoplanes hotanensis]|uniref:YbaB/EbfC family nucleoid-associated protein n=1 Tax=Paractinoplanes hotanensis TaxID=2906497 RepID=A0ABT0YDX3_9ACTN|nr:YbaB/EbfC family nucleoid-associated protein [Actinoplanes hotanensis]MCM4084241.1 YbaB/EbfC family nucleoid-associated protein [Actinoplanes hotanensis]
MTGPVHDMMEKSFTAFEEQKRAVETFEKAVAEAETTVTAKNRAVSVTVDGRGDLTDVKFPTNAYRTMAPAELSSLLVETVTSARDQARAGMNELLEAILPGGMAADFLTNSVHIDEMMDEAMRAANQMFPGSAPASGERR